MSDRLGSAQWEPQPAVSRQYPFAEGKFWLGRAEDDSPIGYRDDRHICLVSGSRGGKGTSVILNNLCFWPGSAVVVDPKGENATVTAARRGQGSEHCSGMGQAVHVLDPFEAAIVDDCYRSSFNPLDALDPERDETIDEATRLANAIVVVKDDAHEPFWDESARAMVRGLILHVLTAPHFTDDERNLITVRNLIVRGEWQIFAAIREQGHAEEKIDPPHLLLWRAMERNPAYDGLVAGVGSRFRNMMKSSEKTFDGILQNVDVNTEFLDSPGMRRCLAKSDFKLSELKTRPEGMTLYLSLPQRYMETHYRWLRMMVGLTTTEMELTRGQPATGHPVLMVLDEFAGLKRMTAIENAVAQIAGYGVKLFFVLQSLEQLKGTYKDHWETFLSNAGVKIFFSVEDHFTREYVSKLAGETEIIRELHSTNESQAESESRAEGRSESQSRSQSTTKGVSSSVSKSKTDGVNQSRSRSETTGVNQSDTTGSSRGFTANSAWGRMTPIKNSPGEYSYEVWKDTGYSRTWGTSQSRSTGTSQSTTNGTTDGTSTSWGSSETRGQSLSETAGISDTTGTSQTYTQGTSRTTGTGRSESVHRRPLIQPDEVGRLFTRIDDKTHPAYPGLALVIVTGSNPLMVRRSQYFEDPLFIDCFSPHPDHEFLPARCHTVAGIRPLIETLEAHMLPNGTGEKRLTIMRWLIEPGKSTTAGEAAARIEKVPPDNRTVFIHSPHTGKVAETAAAQNRLAPGEYAIPDGALFTVKSYSGSGTNIDPFAELRLAAQACLEKKTGRRQTAAYKGGRFLAGRISRFREWFTPLPIDKKIAAILAGVISLLLIFILIVGMVLR
jgi:type IV secretory pathway TraG/TraD family ATPase VirD4